ncbi:MAG: hypothetical protein FJ088_06300, partial [Deltaproteobacteria bacterium]|nr:hypothetical protein [Deltaproteobacteria bacterium]
MKLFVVFFAMLLCSCGGGGDTRQEDIFEIPFIKETATNNDEGGTNHAPELEKIGDRVVLAGEEVKIEVKAFDADGDSLTFSIYGEMPEGAVFDKTDRIFTWTPHKAGVFVYLTFVVSDGNEIDKETVEFKVVDSKTGSPPVLALISDAAVKPDEIFFLKIAATDPDGDKLKFGVSSE